MPRSLTPDKCPCSLYGVPVVFHGYLLLRNLDNGWERRGSESCVVGVCNCNLVLLQSRITTSGKYMIDRAWIPAQKGCSRVGTRTRCGLSSGKICAVFTTASCWFYHCNIGPRNKNDTFSPQFQWTYTTAPMLDRQHSPNVGPTPLS